MHKFKRLQKILGITADNHVHKSTGKPCSCYLCSPYKYKQNGTKKREFNSIRFEKEDAV